MAQFELTQGQDPFLHISLSKGETIFAESDAMVMMDATLDLEASMQGGFFKSMARKFANDSSFFRQKVTAERGDGDILLAPKFSGNIEIIDIDRNNEYYLNDGVHIASQDTIQMDAVTQGVFKAMAGGTGGFFITHAYGHGKIAVGSYGDIFALDIDESTPRLIDNNHVVAWSTTLQYSLSASTSQKKGLIGNLINSQLTGEAMITKFSGRGRVYICSRNKIDFAAWIASLLPAQNK